MIGIYDSGVGGLSIYKSLKHELPRENFLYIADQKFFPYGSKSTKIIKERADAACSWLEDEGVKLIVIACNTATVFGLDYVRKRHPNTPIVGTVPVIKKCAQLSKNGNIGVLCTPKTARSHYQKNLIHSFARGKNVYVRAPARLVEMIEAEDMTNKTIQTSLQVPLSYLKNKNIDTLALGCSHFPLVSKHIQKIIGENVLLLDSGHAIARQVKRVLTRNKMIKRSKREGTITFFTTANPKNFDTIGSKYLHSNIYSKKIDI